MTTLPTTRSSKRQSVENGALDKKWLLLIDILLATFLLGIFIMLVTGNL